MTLFQTPVTKEDFERGLLTIPTKEAESRREFWTLCEALQAMEDIRCPPPDWCIPTLNENLDEKIENRAEGLRALRNRLIDYMAAFEKLPRIEKQRKRQRAMRLCMSVR